QTVDDLRRKAPPGEKARRARLPAPFGELSRIEGSREDPAGEFALFARVRAHALGDPFLDFEPAQLILDAKRAETAFLPPLGAFGRELAVIDVAKYAKPSKHPAHERCRRATKLQCVADLSLAAAATRQHTKREVHTFLATQGSRPAATFHAWCG